MGQRIDLTGQKFVRLLVVEYINDGKWKCKCDCGNERIVDGGSLREGNTKSCGCYNREVASKLMTKHGGYKKPEFRSWMYMKGRCFNRKNTAYPNYGGRGIKVCERWLNFENFYADMGDKPTPKHEIDRIDNNGNYELDNCKWSTRKEQMGNTRRNRWLNYGGESMILSDWARRFGVTRKKLGNQLIRKSFEVIAAGYVLKTQLDIINYNYSQFKS